MPGSMTGHAVAPRAPAYWRGLGHWQVPPSAQPLDHRAAHLPKGISAPSRAPPPLRQPPVAVPSEPQPSTAAVEDAWINDRLTGGWGRAPEGQGAEAKGDVAEHRCCTIVQHFRRFIGMASTLGFRPTPDDERILREAARPGESRSDVLRRALRLLDHDAWLAQFHRDAEGLKHEDVNADTEAW